VSNLTNVQTLAGGDAHSLAIMVGGAVWAWGYNTYGQLGIGSTADSSVPVRVSTLSSVAAITAGAYHSVAATTAGAVWDWGNNQFGQLGNGTTNQSTVPLQVPLQP
jgi:alpha-tubulin suppressor-like RCC1 family protein